MQSIGLCPSSFDRVSFLLLWSFRRWIVRRCLSHSPSRSFAYCLAGSASSLALVFRLGTIPMMVVIFSIFIDFDFIVVSITYYYNHHHHYQCRCCFCYTYTRIFTYFMKWHSDKKKLILCLVIYKKNQVFPFSPIFPPLRSSRNSKPFLNKDSSCGWERKKKMPRF